MAARDSRTPRTSGKSRTGGKPLASAKPRTSAKPRASTKPRTSAKSGKPHRDTRPPRHPAAAGKRPPQRGQRPPRRHEEAAPPPQDNLARISGVAAVTALFAMSPKRVMRLFFDERTKPMVAPYLAELGKARKPYRELPGDELARVAGTPMHGGVVALAQPRPVLTFDVGEAERWAMDGKPLLLLDGIGNPQNLGAIARTAAFFGLPRIVLSDHPGQAAPSDASYRIAEGGLEYINVYRCEGFAPALTRLRRTYRVVGTSAESGLPLSALRATGKPVALVLGNEEKGLPRATLDACDQVITLRGGGRVQSLNVSATAAILIQMLAAT